MGNPKWEKYKKNDYLEYFTLDEILVLIVGFLVFFYLQQYRLIFIIFIILWYWIKIRYYERRIIDKKREIYNVYYENIEPIPQPIIDARTEKDRKPMQYDLEQLENKRRFLVDKFVVLNLRIVVLIELFIRK